MRQQSGCGNLIGGLMFVLMGAVFLLVFGQRVDLTCTRQETRLVVCEKRQSFLGLVPWKETQFSGVHGTYVEDNCDEGCTYRVVMLTETEDIPLTGAYTSGYNAKVRTAREIDAFLASGDRTFVLRDGPNMLGVMFPGVFMAVGFAWVAGTVLTPFLGRRRW